MTLEKAASKTDVGVNQISIIEGTVKFRDGKKWKSRWCVMRKLSPVADCVHLQLYRDVKEREKNGQTKASLSLQQFLGLESGFTLDKESNTLAILCRDVSPVLAFCSVETLIQWRTRAARALGAADAESRVFPALLAQAPSACRVARAPVRLHVVTRSARLCLTTGLPPKVIGAWDIGDLRRYGLVEGGRLCFEVGARGGRTEGAWVLLADRADKLLDALKASAAHSRMAIANDNTRKQLKLKIDKRLTDVDECTEFDTSIDQLSEAESSIGFGESASVIDVQIGKHSISESLDQRMSNNSRCIGCMNQLGMQPNMNGSDCASWAMDSMNESHRDMDRASIYSRSSGGASDYSMSKATPWKELGQNYKSPSSLASFMNSSDISRRMCACCSSQRNHKSFSGPYENYDVPKPPMPLIKENPQTLHHESLYDVPKKLRCLVNDPKLCNCSASIAAVESSLHILENNPINDIEVPVVNLDKDDDINSSTVTLIPTSQLNYTNVESITEINENLSTLEEFESSFQILTNAGFSPDEIKAMDDTLKNEPLSDLNQNTEPENNNTANTCYRRHQHYLCMEPQEPAATRTLPRANKATKQSHCYEVINTSLNYSSRRKSSSADFLKKAEEFCDMVKSNSQKDISFEINPLRRKMYDFTNENPLHLNINTIAVEKKEPVIKSPEKFAKPDSNFLAKFKDSVKIRRSSSVPSKSEKNRDSSSSSDSGVSTGSLKYHSYLPSDPMQQISFQFHEGANLLKSDFSDGIPIFLRRHNRVLTSSDLRTIRSPSSCGSETSDYFETLSISSISSNETSNRSTTRPRSGREYSTIQSTLRRQPACDRCCHLSPEV